MLAKIIVHAPPERGDRARNQAIEDSSCWGCETNAAFLGRILGDEGFGAAKSIPAISTNHRASRGGRADEASKGGCCGSGAADSASAYAADAIPAAMPPSEAGGTGGTCITPSTSVKPHRSGFRVSGGIAWRLRGEVGCLACPNTVARRTSDRLTVAASRSLMWSRGMRLHHLGAIVRRAICRSAGGPRS